MNTAKLSVVLFIALGLAAGVTIPKLWTMCQIKGWLPGAITAQETVTQKWYQSAEEHPRGWDTYWISWSDTDIRTVGLHRINVEPQYWESVAVGDPLEVVRLPNDARPHLRNDIFVSVGNFSFDLALLAVEIGVALIMLVILARNVFVTERQSTLSHKRRALYFIDDPRNVA
jgi:hypothetical protein